MSDNADRPAWWRALLTEPQRPAWVRESPSASGWVVATVCVGAFMGQLDASIVTVAFPTLQAEFAAPLGAVEWVALSYLLVLVTAVVAVGRFADMMGRKLLYTYGFVVFALASAGCGLATSLGMLVGLRVLQAIGAAMLQANSVALIATSVRPGKLGRAIGAQGAAQALGLALGPTVGGLLIAWGGWRLIFLVNVPAGVIGVVSAWFLLPRSRYLAPRVRFDWVGLALFVPVVTALLLALSLGRDAGFTNPWILGLFALCAVTLVGFVLWERRVDNPMVDLTLFARPQFSAGIMSGLLSYAVLFGVLFAVPFLFERGLGLSTSASGLILTTLPVALGLVSPFAGRLADKVGARPLTLGGMAITALALLAGALLPPSIPTMVAVLAAVGVGGGLFTAPNNAAIMGSAPREASGSAGGLLNMTRGIGTSMGVVLAGLALGSAAAAGAHESVVASGFTVAFLLLAVLAAVSAGICLVRGPAAH